MDYTIRQFAGMAGVSTRTLRYYDEIGLLKPACVNSSGYRIYSSKEAAELQQILLYRQLGVDLGTIQGMLRSPNFDVVTALRQHLKHLHHQWLLNYWHDYSKEAHARLAQMYVDDERFRESYDNIVPGGAAFLRDAISAYTGITEG